MENWQIVALGIGIALFWCLGGSLALGLNERALRWASGSCADNDRLGTFIVWPVVVGYWLLKPLVPKITRRLLAVANFFWDHNPFRTLYRLGMAWADYVDPPPDRQP